ncbi:MAG: DUF502 domain-containing protein [Burkholderiales bacterium]
MRKYFITGLLVWIPLIITVWVLTLLNGWMDASLLLIPKSYRPETLLGFYVPGVGVVLTVALLFITGLLTANLLGRRLILLWESMLAHIPVVKTIYGGVKQVSDTLFSGQGQAFRKALLVRYPHQGSWSVAFQTGRPRGEIAEILKEEHVSVFIPTTPNPTSGFFMIMPKKDVIELNMSVDAALKYIISMGVVSPEPPPRH